MRLRSNASRFRTFVPWQRRMLARALQRAASIKVALYIQLSNKLEEWAAPGSPAVQWEQLWEAQPAQRLELVPGMLRSAPVWRERSASSSSCAPGP